MTFFNLSPNDFFGGGVLLLKDHRDEEKSVALQTDKKALKTHDFGTLSVVRVSTILIYLDCRFR